MSMTLTHVADGPGGRRICMVGPEPPAVFVDDGCTMSPDPGADCVTVI